jgi:hypothetical protein
MKVDRVDGRDAVESIEFEELGERDTASQVGSGIEIEPFQVDTYSPDDSLYQAFKLLHAEPP